MKAPVHAAGLDDVATINKTTSPLLRLPGEVRNIIYEYALSDRTLHYRKYNPVIDNSNNTDQRLPSLNHETSKNSTIHIYNLSLTCHKIFEETHELAYRLSRFVIDCPEVYRYLVSGRNKDDFKKLEIDLSRMLDVIVSFECDRYGYSPSNQIVTEDVMQDWKQMFRDFALVPRMSIRFARRKFDEYITDFERFHLRREQLYDLDRVLSWFRYLGIRIQHRVIKKDRWMLEITLEHHGYIR